jgi:hypothetical protein
LVPGGWITAWIGLVALGSGLHALSFQGARAPADELSKPPRWLGHRELALTGLLVAEVRQLEAVFGRFWLFLRCAVMMDQWLRSVLTINSCSSKAITPTIDEVRLPALQ